VSDTVSGEQQLSVDKDLQVLAAQELITLGVLAAAGAVRAAPASSLRRMPLAEPSPINSAGKQQ
jgi:hypothetical protein